MKLGTHFIFILASIASSSFVIAEQAAVAELKQQIAKKCSRDNATLGEINECLKKEYACLIAILKTRQDSDLALKQTQSPDEIMNEIRAFLPAM